MSLLWITSSVAYSHGRCPRSSPTRQIGFEIFHNPNISAEKSDYIIWYIPYYDGHSLSIILKSPFWKTLDKTIACRDAQVTSHNIIIFLKFWYIYVVVVGWVGGGQGNLLPLVGKLSLKADEPQVGQRYEGVEGRRECYHIIFPPRKELKICIKREEV